MEPRTIKGIKALRALMCGAIGRKEHAQFPNGIDPTGTAQFADKRFCCQNVWVDEGLVGTSDERMAQMKSCPLAGQNDQMTPDAPPAEPPILSHAKITSADVNFEDAGFEAGCMV